MNYSVVSVKALLFLALGSFGAFAEQSTVIGTIDKVVGREIQVKTRTRTLVLFVDDQTVIRGAAPLKAGNEVSVRCRTDGSGKLVAVRIWASVVAFSATIRHVDGDDIEVITSSNSDSQREEHKIVHLHADTAFGTNRKDVMAGQYVRVVGLEVENGAVDATRITIYNTDIPARR